MGELMALGGAENGRPEPHYTIDNEPMQSKNIADMQELARKNKVRRTDS